MRDLTQLDKHRMTGPDVIKSYGWVGDSTCGCFRLVLPGTGKWFLIVASTGAGWDHLSVSCNDRPPNWMEMDRIKRMFFKDDEVAWQYHVAEKDHINIHPNALHVWRKQGFDMPLPPKEFV